MWNFFRLEAEHLNNVGEFRAVRDISLHPIKLALKDEIEEEDVLSPLPTLPQTAAPLRVVHVTPSNSRSASIKSLSISHSPNTPMITSCCTVVIENPRDDLTAAATKLELTNAGQDTTRTESKKSTETLTTASDEIELASPHQHNVDLQMVEESAL